MRETPTPSIPSHRLLDLAATTAPPHTVPLLRALALLEEACADLRLGLLEEGAAARPAAAEAIAARLEALLTAVPTVPSSLALLLALLDLIPRDHRRDEPPDTGPALRRALEAALPRDGRPGRSIFRTGPGRSSFGAVRGAGAPCCPATTPARRSPADPTPICGPGFVTSEPTSSGSASRPERPRGPPSTKSTRRG